MKNKDIKNKVDVMLKDLEKTKKMLIEELEEDASNLINRLFSDNEGNEGDKLFYCTSYKDDYVFYYYVNIYTNDIFIADNEIGIRDKIDYKYIYTL